MSEFLEITEPTLILSISVRCPDIEPDSHEATRYARIIKAGGRNIAAWSWRAGGYGSWGVSSNEMDEGY